MNKKNFKSFFSIFLVAIILVASVPTQSEAGLLGAIRDMAKSFSKSSGGSSGGKSSGGSSGGGSISVTHNSNKGTTGGAVYQHEYVPIVSGGKMILELFAKGGSGGYQSEAAWADQYGHTRTKNAAPMGQPNVGGIYVSDPSAINKLYGAGADKVLADYIAKNIDTSHGVPKDGGKPVTEIDISKILGDPKSPETSKKQPLPKEIVVAREMIKGIWERFKEGPTSPTPSNPSSPSTPTGGGGGKDRDPSGPSNPKDPPYDGGQIYETVLANTKTETKVDTEVEYRLLSLELKLDFEEYAVINGKIDYNKSNSGTWKDLKSNTKPASPKDAWEKKLSDLSITSEKPTYHKANSTSTAKYIEVIKKVTSTRDVTTPTYIAYDASGNVLVSKDLEPTTTAWAESGVEYSYGNTTDDVKNSTFASSLVLPEYTQKQPIDLTSNGFISASGLNISADSSRIKAPKSVNGNLSVSIMDKSGLQAGEEFALTSSNIPKNFSTSNGGWLGITEDGFTFGDQTPNGSVGQKFINEAKLYYGPYTKSNDSIKKNSIELITQTGSQGESKGKSFLTVKNQSDADKAKDLTFKLRSIKFGDYKIGDPSFDAMYVLATLNTQNVEGFDNKSFAKGDTISHTLEDTKSNYNNFIIVADFVQPYLHGNFTVKDVAGSN